MDTIPLDSLIYKELSTAVLPNMKETTGEASPTLHAYHTMQPP